MMIGKLYEALIESYTLGGRLTVDVQKVSKILPHLKGMEASILFCLILHHSGDPISETSTPYGASLVEDRLEFNIHDAPDDLKLLTGEYIRVLAGKVKLQDFEY